MTLNEKIKKLEEQIKSLQSKIEDLTNSTDNKYIAPYTKTGAGVDKSRIRSTDISTGLGRIFGGNAVWNDSELKLPPYGQAPPEPTKGYNKHGHSRFAGGALDINTLELVEYENTAGVILDQYGNPVNKHCQQFWKNHPNIVKTENPDGEQVEKIGNLDIEFDPALGKWVTGSKQIDVELTNLVKKDDEGKVIKDENNNEMKAPMYGVDVNTQNVIWDKNGRCWRFLAVYSDN